MPKLTAAAVAAGTMAKAVQPEFRIDELVLRPWMPADVAALVVAYRDPAIQRWHGRSMTPQEAVEYVAAAHAGWAAESGAHWAVLDPSGVVGRISVRVDLTEGVGSIGYWVLPPSRGRGVGTRMLRVAAEWAFLDLGMHRLEIEHSTSNGPSCRVATKAGFALESTKRSNRLHADGWHDMHLHARIGSDAG